MGAAAKHLVNKLTSDLYPRLLQVGATYSLSRYGREPLVQNRRWSGRSSAALVGATPADLIQPRCGHAIEVAWPENNKPVGGCFKGGEPFWNFEAAMHFDRGNKGPAVGLWEMACDRNLGIYIPEWVKGPRAVEVCPIDDLAAGSFPRNAQPE